MHSCAREATREGADEYSVDAADAGASIINWQQDAVAVPATPESVWRDSADSGAR